MTKENNEIKVKVNGGELIASIKGDVNYPGINLFYRRDNGNEYDIAVAEVPVENKSKDVNIYLYEDPESEDWTDKFVLKSEAMDAYEAYLEEIDREDENDDENETEESTYKIYFGDKCVAETSMLHIALLTVTSNPVPVEKKAIFNGTKPILTIFNGQIVVYEYGDDDSKKIMSYLKNIINS